MLKGLSWVFSAAGNNLVSCLTGCKSVSQSVNVRHLQDCISYRSQWMHYFTLCAENVTEPPENTSSQSAQPALDSSLDCDCCKYFKAMLWCIVSLVHHPSSNHIVSCFVLHGALQSSSLLMVDDNERINDCCCCFW